MAALGRFQGEPLDQRVEDGEAEGSAVFDPCGATSGDSGVLGMAAAEAGAGEDGGQMGLGWRGS